jgi:hypothetical protein
MDRKQRIDGNEKFFREVNERVAQMQAGYLSDHDPEWVCQSDCRVPGDRSHGD